MSIKILLLEDDSLFGESLVDLLEDEGYEVSLCANGQMALDAVYESRFDLYLFDINVPLIDGISLLSELRKNDDATPAIFLTSHSKKEKLKEGFLSGCDDYLRKPFENEELLLRMEALLKRVQKHDKVYTCDFCLDYRHKTIFYREIPLELSKKEFELLALFIKHSNETVTKEMIVDELYSASETPSDGAVRVYINRLKQLLPEVTFENIRGVGYRLVC